MLIVFFPRQNILLFTFNHVLRLRHIFSCILPHEEVSKLEKSSLKKKKKIADSQHRHYCHFGQENVSLCKLVSHIWRVLIFLGLYPLTAKNVSSQGENTPLSSHLQSTHFKTTAQGCNDPGWESFSSVQFSRSVMFDSLWPYELQHARPPCPSPTPRVHRNLCPSSWWCHPTISSSVVPFSSRPQSLPASGHFPVKTFTTT